MLDPRFWERPVVVSILDRVIQEARETEGKLDCWECGTTDKWIQAWPIKPLDMYPELALDRWSYQPFCFDCWSVKMAEEMGIDLQDLAFLRGLATHHTNFVKHHSRIQKIA